MNSRILAIALCLLGLTGCAASPSAQSNAGQPSRVVELQGAEAHDAIEGLNRGGVYVDVMPDGTYVFDDTTASPDALKQKVSSYVFGGGRLVTIRVAHNAPASNVEFARTTIANTGVPRIEIVNAAARS